MQMNEIKLVIEIPGLVEALREVAAAVAGKATREAPSLTWPPETLAEYVAEPSTATESVAEAPAPEPTPDEATIHPTPCTVSDLSRAGAALIDQGKMPQLIELLKKYGVQAVTQLKEDVYGVFMEDLKALGATF